MFSRARPPPDYLVRRAGSTGASTIRPSNAKTPRWSGTAASTRVRSSTLLAAKAFGRFALDSVYLDIKDLDGLAAETSDAVAVGFDVKVAIHPSQVAVIARGLRARPRRTRLGAPGAGGGARPAVAFRVRGSMVDAPVLRHAEAIVRRAGVPG